MKMKHRIWDYLFELTEYSDNEGERILDEAFSMGEACGILEDNGFDDEDYKYITKISVLDGERLGLDTY